MQIQSFDYQQRVAGEVMLTVHVARGQTGSPRSMTDPHRDRSSQCPAPSGAEAAP